MQHMTEAALADHLATLPRGARSIVGVAGAPGSGKSTLAEHLVDRLNGSASNRAAVFPMDGYHYDDMLLGQMGLLERKGSPDTFDVAGLFHMLGRLKANAEDHIAVPVFDRDIEIARAGARLIPQNVDIVVAEGNYLLLDRAPWSGLAAQFDCRVFLDVPEDVLRERLAARWTGYGLSDDGIRAKLDENDLPNGRLVATQSIAADITVAPRA